jgi:putative FmdB family regulatory protein
MMRLFDFKCDTCGHVDEYLVHNGQREHTCSCGGKAYRQMSMPTVRLEGITGAFPSAHTRWAKVREDNRRNMEKRDLLT